MISALLFSVLGPLGVTVDGRHRTVAAGRQRILLAALLLNANKVVSIDRLADFVWDGSPPPTAAPTIRTYVMRLRRALGDVAGDRIRTRSPGYLIDIGERESDLDRFMGHRKTANSLIEQGDLAGAARELRSALALWQAPLVDIPSSLLQDSELHHLRKLHLQTMSTRFDVDIRLGQHSSVIPELWRAVMDDPTHEPMVARLMLALHRSGHRAEALRLYQDTRQQLVRQMGTEPGPEMRRMQQRILADEEPVPPGPERAAATAAVKPAARVVPTQLPAAPPDFTGRERETGQLTRMLDPREDRPRPALTVLLTGPAGVGKSALGLHTAHALRDAFPDGQLYADLGEVPATSGQREPSAPDPLTRFLKDLGTPEHRVPDDEDTRAALYRSLLADRKVLIVLDRVTDTAQVRRLLPGSGASRALVISRERHTRLDCARVMRLRRLDLSASLDMLGHLIGARRVTAEPEAAYRIVTACAGLPLALNIVAARFLDRDGWTLDDMAFKLTREGRLLNELRDGERSVHDALESGYAAVRRRYAGDAHAIGAVMHAIGAQRVSQVHSEPLASTLNWSIKETERILDQLVDMWLLDSPAPDEYVANGLVRAFAQAMAAPWHVQLPAPEGFGGHPADGESGSCRGIGAAVPKAVTGS